MASGQGPTSADLTKLTTAIKDMARVINSMSDSLRVANINLVALHAVIQDRKDNDGSDPSVSARG